MYIVIAVVKMPGMCGPRVTSLLTLTKDPLKAFEIAQRFVETEHPPIIVELVLIGCPEEEQEYSWVDSYILSGKFGEVLKCVLIPSSVTEKEHIISCNGFKEITRSFLEKT